MEKEELKAKIADTAIIAEIPEMHHEVVEEQIKGSSEEIDQNAEQDVEQIDSDSLIPITDLEEISDLPQIQTDSKVINEDFDGKEVKSKKEDAELEQDGQWQKDLMSMINNF